MSKELTPLKAFYDLLSPIDLKEEGLKRYYLIETALKDYEMEHTLRIRLENINYELVKEKQENEKKLKALEIIKEKVLEDLVFNDKEQEINFSFGISAWCIKIKDKDKYYLLKEVIL